MSVSRDDLCRQIRQKIISVQEFDLPTYPPSSTMILQLPNLAGSVWHPSSSWFQFRIRYTMTNQAGDNLYVPQYAPDSFIDRGMVISPGNSTTVHNIPDCRQLNSLINTAHNIMQKTFHINAQPVNETSFAFQSAPFQSNYYPYLVNSIPLNAGQNVIEISSMTYMSDVFDICAIDALLPLGYLSAGSRSAMRFEFNLVPKAEMGVLQNGFGPTGTIDKIEIFPVYNMTTLIISEALNAEIERKIMTNSEYLIPINSYTGTSQSVQSGISSLSTRLFIDEESVSNLLCGFKPSLPLSATYDPVQAWSSGNMNYAQHKAGQIYYPAQPITRQLDPVNRRDAYQFMAHVLESKYTYQSGDGINTVPTLYHTPAWDQSQQFMFSVNLDSGCSGVYSAADIKRIGNGTVELLTRFGVGGAFASALGGTLYFWGQFNQVFVLGTGGLRSIDKMAYNAIVDSMSAKEEDMLNELLEISGVSGPKRGVL